MKSALASPSLLNLGGARLHTRFFYRLLGLFAACPLVLFYIKLIQFFLLNHVISSFIKVPDADAP